MRGTHDHDELKYAGNRKDFNGQLRSPNDSTGSGAAELAKAAEETARKAAQDRGATEAEAEREAEAEAPEWRF